MAKFFQKLKKIVQRVGIFASKTHATVVNIPNTRFYKKSRRIAHQSVSALNGAIGDSLHTTPLGIGMGFYAHEQALLIDKESLTVHFATQPATPKIALLIHGLTHNETAWDMADQTNYGLLLQKDFGYTPLFLRYNTGLHISDNGKMLADMLEALVQSYPTNIEEICVVAHSMGGLITHSACHYAQANNLGWTQKVRYIFLLGSPHLGSFLEKFANVTTNILQVIPTISTRTVGKVLNWRSAGIKDLRFGYLTEDDWKDLPPDRLLLNKKTPPKKLSGVLYYVISGRLTQAEKHWVHQLFGDILVRTSSATASSSNPNEFNFAPENHYEFGKTNHFKLTKMPEVYAKIKAWIAAEVAE